jgi:E3 ubiquitin-protein ligase SHPRH
MRKFVLTSHCFAGVVCARKLNAALDRFRGTSMQIVPGPGKAGRQKEKREQTKEQVQVQVLLLPIRHGANGLNLVEAQHVILMEPLLNPGAEAQAINRVHRIGQQHVTYVHRFIVSYRLTQWTILLI